MKVGQLWGDNDITIRITHIGDETFGYAVEWSRYADIKNGREHRRRFSSWDAWCSESDWERKDMTIEELEEVWDG